MLMKTLHESDSVKQAIAVVGTLDTKFSEILFLRDYIAERGFDAKIIDASMLKHDHELDADFTCRQVAAEAGVAFDNLHSTNDRDYGTRTIAEGLSRILERMVAGNELDGVISVGGAQGTSISSTAFKKLPIGFPKLIVSAVASGNIRPYVGARDILIMFSVADINGGVNEVTRTILANAAAAIMGMVRDGQRLSLTHTRPVIGITAWGTTQRAVMAAATELRSRGFEPVIFHSSGACTSAMESLIEEGFIDGVLDLTTHDFLGELFPQETQPPVNPGRLATAADRGIPLIVAPGGLNMFVMGPYDELKEEYKSRPMLKHNPTLSEVQVTVPELLTVAEAMAERLNAARAYCAFIVPLRGWNDYDAEGSVLYNPQGDKAFVKRLRELLNPNVEIIEIDSNLNSPEVGRVAAELLTKHFC